MIYDFPLAWPVGWRRCAAREAARFGTASRVDRDLTGAERWTGGKKLTIAGGADRLLDELERLDAGEIVISSNYNPRRHRNDGNPDDPGAAVYFRIAGKPSVLACDKWDRLADNLAALAKHVQAVRGQIRWGVGTLEQAFGGYRALPAMAPSKTWREILHLNGNATLEQARRSRDALLQRHHPDKGGSHDSAAEINSAFDEASRELGTGFTAEGDGDPR